MINVEGIPIVAARLAQAEQAAKKKLRYNLADVRRRASRRLQRNYVAASFAQSEKQKPRSLRHAAMAA